MGDLLYLGGESGAASQLVMINHGETQFHMAYSQLYLAYEARPPCFQEVISDGIFDGIFNDQSIDANIDAIPSYFAHQKNPRYMLFFSVRWMCLTNLEIVYFEL